MCRETTVLSLAACLVAVSVAGSPGLVITIEDFSKPAIASYIQYGGDITPAGSALLRGWEVGGRYFRFEDLGTDRIMAAAQSYSGLDVGSKLALTSSEYRPAWDAAQASEALNLAEFDDLQFQLVNRIGVAGTPPVPFTLTMYFYDASDSTAKTVTVLSTNGGAWAVNEVKTFTVATNAITGFDKATDLVYGFKLDGYIRIGATYGPIAWTNIAMSRSTPELTPPDAVTDLVTSNIEPRAVRLTWTSPADPSGIWDRAVSYDVRYSTAPIDESNWAAAAQATGEPTPGPIGGSDTMMVTGLAPLTDYWFAIKATDTCGNVSAISNIPTARTLDPDVTPPAAVTNLAASDVHPNSVTLHWSATGDDGLLGQASSYDLRYSLSPINEGNFAAATPVATAAPKLSGAAEAVTVHSLTAGVTYYFAIKVIDEWPLASGLSNIVTVDTPAADAEPPYAVTDLRVLGTQSGAVHVTFTAPADRGSAGVQGYEVRYSTSPIDASNWGSATVAAQPAAAAPGTAVNAAITNLIGSTTYYVAVKSSDWAEPSNVSDLSNVASATTLPPISAITLRNPWIANDRVADCRTLQTLAATFGNAYTPNGVVVGATDQDKVINEYNNFKRREYHWSDDPPNRFDVVWNINVHGHSLCGGQADQNVCILEAMGFNARCGTIPGHTIYDVYYDGQWHLFDTMMTMYVFDRSNPPKVASAAQIAADKTLMTAAVAEGRACPGFLLCPDNVTWFADGTSNWSPFDEDGGATTYSMNSELHYGETFDRTWESWYNQHPTPRTSADSLPGLDAPYHHCARNDWKDTVNFPYWEPYALTQEQHTALNIGYGYCYRRWANGTYTLQPDFRSAGYQAAVHGTPVAISTVGADTLMPQLHASAANTLAEIVFKVVTPFSITDGSISGDFVRTAGGDVTRLYISTNGTSYTQIWDNTALGTTHLENLSLRSAVFGRSSYYIKVQLKGVAGKTDAGVNNLVIRSVFQHNKGAMAYLDKGVNHITVTFDNPAELAGSGAAFKVVYKWKEYDGTGWTIPKQHEQYILTSPTTFTITTGGSKVPKTESIVMELGEPPFDPYMPAAVSTLATETPDSYSLGLTWTATGDDGLENQASRYDIRYSTAPIDADNWASATPVANPPAPQMPGSTEHMTVNGLEARTGYYFALKVGDEAGNWSGLSNVAWGETLPPDEIPPAWVCNLVARTSKTSEAVDLTWTASGDDGNAGTARTYDIRYSTAPIDADNFAAATPAAGEPTPKPAGSAETFTITGLTGGGRYYFALKVADERPNWSEVSNTAVAASSRLGEKVLQTGLNSYNGCRDNYTQSGTPTANFNGYERMRVTGYADQNDIQRGYIKFDLTSIPAGTTIRSAKLRLYSYDTSKMQGSSGFYGAYRITRNWNDATMNWNVADAGVNWTAPGGDFEAVADALSPKNPNKVPQWYEWDVTARVQEWVNSPAGNFGWCIRAEVETAHLQDQFYQSDAPGSTYRPQLVISDSLPLLPCDADCSGEIDVLDLLTLAEAWNTACGVDRAFNPMVDFYEDGVIDVVDLLTLAEHWPTY